MKSRPSFSIPNLVLWLAISIAIFQILERVGYEWSGVHNTDATIYSAIGRGILNGLTPYRDLFETKPPGIFLLHAASLAIADSDIILRVLQIAILLSLPFVGSYANETNRLVGFSFGCILSLYLAYESGEMQVESYGVFFSILFISCSRIRRAPLRLALQTLCLMAAIGMKEPFLLSLLASALVLEPRRLVQSFLVPLALSITLGTIVMWMLGYLGPYFQIYLPYMTGFRSHRFGSPIVRAFDLSKTGGNLWAFSPFLLALVVGLIAVCLWHSRKDKLATAALGVAVYCASFAVGTGGDYVGHHFMFALPLYAALFFKAAQWWDSRYAIGQLTACTFFHTQTAYAYGIQQDHAEDVVAIETARRVDALLDSCSIDLTPSRFQYQCL